jgi:hypothetical protein
MRFVRDVHLSLCRLSGASTPTAYLLLQIIRVIRYLQSVVSGDRYIGPIKEKTSGLPIADSRIGRWPSFRKTGGGFFNLSVRLIPFPACFTDRVLVEIFATPALAGHRKGRQGSMNIDQHVIQWLDPQMPMNRSCSAARRPGLVGLLDGRLTHQEETSRCMNWWWQAMPGSISQERFERDGWPDLIDA